MTHTGNGTLTEGEVNEEESGEEAVAPPVIGVVPMHYWWISTLHRSPDMLLGRGQDAPLLFGSHIIAANAA